MSKVGFLLYSFWEITVLDLVAGVVVWYCALNLMSRWIRRRLRRLEV